METITGFEDLVTDTLILRMGLSSIPRENAMARIIAIQISGAPIEQYFLSDDSQEYTTSTTRIYDYFKKYVNSKSIDFITKQFGLTEIWSTMDSEFQAIARNVLYDWAELNNVTLRLPVLRNFTHE